MIQISIILLFSTVKEGTDKNRHIYLIFVILSGLICMMLQRKYRTVGTLVFQICVVLNACVVKLETNVYGAYQSS